MDLPKKSTNYSSCERKGRETSKVKYYISSKLHSRAMMSGESQKLVESN